MKRFAGLLVLIFPVLAMASEPVKVDSPFNIDDVKFVSCGNAVHGQVLLEQNPPKFTPDVPEHHEMLPKGSCDKDGESHFSRVPAGEYFVIAFIIWDDTTGAATVKTGGAAMKRISVPPNFVLSVQRKD